MRIKNLKYIFGSVVLGLPLFFNVVFGSGCINNATSGEDTEHIYSCDVPNGSPLPYWNSTPLESFSSQAQLFLKMVNIDRVPCAAGSEALSEDLVRRIQRKMQAVGDNCSSCIDGKLGNITKNNLSNCPAKACLDPYMVPILQGNTLTCENENYEIKNVGIGEAYCCKLKEIEITISPPTIEKQSWDSELKVYVYSNVEGTGLTQNNLNCDTNKFSVDGGNIQEITPDEIGDSSENEAGCVLHIQTDNNSVTVSVLEGIIQIGEKKSSSGSNTFTTCAFLPSSEGECSIHGGNFAYNFETNCCDQVSECLNPPENGECGAGMIFDPNLSGCCMAVCDHLPENGNCGSGFKINGVGCCESMCSGDKVYDPSIDNCTGCAEGKIPNGTNTKCVCDSTTACCGIKLNTVVPFIGDCIEMDTDSSRGDTTSVNSMNAFPVLMQGLMKILMSVIMVFSFIMVIVAGLMMTTGAFSNSNFEKGKSMLKNVIISLILLGCSGLILSLINPNFFGG